MIKRIHDCNVMYLIMMHLHLWICVCCVFIFEKHICNLRVIARSEQYVCTCVRECIMYRMYIHILSLTEGDNAQMSLHIYADCSKLASICVTVSDLNLIIRAPMFKLIRIFQDIASICAMHCTHCACTNLGRHTGTN